MALLSGHGVPRVTRDSLVLFRTDGGSRAETRELRRSALCDVHTRPLQPPGINSGNPDQDSVRSE